MLGIVGVILMAIMLLALFGYLNFYGLRILPEVPSYIYATRSIPAFDAGETHAIAHRTA
jgi:hypothetical protein